MKKIHDAWLMKLVKDIAVNFCLFLHSIHSVNIFIFAELYSNFQQVTLCHDTMPYLYKTPQTLQMVTL